MDLRRTEEQVALADVVGNLVATAATPDRVAEIADGADTHDDQLWRRLTVELGVGGLLVPEHLGGSGAGWRELGAVVAELGRRLAPVPYLSSCILAVSAIMSTTDRPEVDDLLNAIMNGSTIATVAMADRIGRLAPDAVTVEARKSDASWVLRGASGFVTDGPAADVAVVLARVDHGFAWFVVESESPGVTFTPMTVLDATRSLAHLALEDAPAQWLGEVIGWEDVEDLIDVAALGLACEQAAASQHLLDLTVAYASERLQFGRPIGSFQAVQHRLADLALLVDEAASAVEFAIWAASEAPKHLREAASLAKVVCSETMRSVATESIQVHGGIGFTWEHVAHRYFRRAHASSVLFGTPAEHRDRMLRAVGV